MIAVIEPSGIELRPFLGPIGERTIIGETIYERLTRIFLEVGIEKVLIIGGECKGAISVSSWSDVEEYVDKGELVLIATDNFYPAEEHIKSFLSDALEEEEEITRVSITTKTSRTINTSLGEAYLTGLRICKRPSRDLHCGSINAILIDNFVHIAKPEDLLDALDLGLKEIKETRISPKAEIASDVIIDGPVIIEEGARIYERVKIKGPAYIGKDVIVGNGSLIRRSAINAGSVVGFSSEVKHSVLEENVNTGRHSYIGDSFIGRGTKVIGSLLTINYKPGKPRKLGAFIAEDKRIYGFVVLKYRSIVERRRL